MMIRNAARSRWIALGLMAVLVPINAAFGKAAHNSAMTQTTVTPAKKANSASQKVVDTSATSKKLSGKPKTHASQAKKTKKTGRLGKNLKAATNHIASWFHPKGTAKPKH